MFSTIWIDNGTTMDTSMFKFLLILMIRLINCSILQVQFYGDHNEVDNLKYPLTFFLVKSRAKRDGC